MVTKRISPTDMVYMALLSLAAIVLFAADILAIMYFPVFLFFGLLVLCGVGWGWWRLISSFRVEFEYALTNGEIDVDKITAQRKRKRLITVDLRSTEILAPLNGAHQAEFERANLQTKIDASESPASPGAYCLIVRHEKRGLTRLYFNPDGRMLAAAKTYAPPKVFDQ